MPIVYKKILGIVCFFILSVFTLCAPPQTAHAAVSACPTGGTQLYGWIWSSNIGWINVNSGNPTGKGGEYCVSISPTNELTGWAWSSSVGWIKFGELSGFPGVGGNAKLEGNKITGWARACTATVKLRDSTTNPRLRGTCDSMTSRPDGWDGWISLSGTDISGNVPYSFTYTTSGTSASVGGYGWGSEVIGWLLPQLTTTVSTIDPQASCSLNSRPIPSKPNYYELSWNSDPQAVGVTTCRGVNFNVNSLVGTAEVLPSVNGTTYTLYCTTTVGTEIMCNSARSLTATQTTTGVGGNGGPQSPVCDQGTCNEVGPGELKLRVQDSRYGVVENTSKKTNIPVARVQKGKPFSLTGFADLEYFDDTTITSSPSVSLDSSLINSAQQITQNASVVTYTLGGIGKDDFSAYRVSIEVHAMDSALEEI